MERELDVRTAEAVAVRYELAGLGSRFLALTVDLALQLAVAAIVFFGFLIAGLLARGAHVPSETPAEAKVGYALLIAAGVILGFLLFFGYFIAFEMWWDGQSPGKRLLGLRVLRDAGFPIDFGASVIRNLVRIVEMGLGFYVVSAIAALVSPENKRLGDMAAGTIVVRDDTAAIPTLATLREDEEAATNDGLERGDRVLIDEYLARRASLDPLAAQTIATAIATRIRPKLRASFHYLDDVSLLEHIARSR